MPLCSECKNVEHASSFYCRFLKQSCPFQKYCHKSHRYEALDAAKCSNFAPKGDVK